MAQATPFDPHCNDPAYWVPNEKRTIPANIGRFRTIIPTHAPFYRKGVIVKSGATVLKEGKDYYLGHQFMKGSHLSAQMMYGSICIINPALTGEFDLSYHKVGDDYAVSASAALQYLTSAEHDPMLETWEDIMGERYMPPIDVIYDIDNWKGEAELITELGTLSNTITSRPATDNDFYHFAKAYVDQLAKIIELGSWRAHGTDKANPHGIDYISAGALKQDAIAVNTNKVAGKTLAELTALVHAAGVDVADIAALFPLNADRNVVGPLKLKDGLSTIGYKKTNGSLRFAFHLKRSNFEFSSEKSVNVVADAQSQHDGTVAKLQSGTNVLEVISSGSSQDSTKLKYNGSMVFTEETLPAAVRGAVSTDSKVYASGSPTLQWMGTGQSSSPLSARVVWPAATAATPGIVKLTTALNVSDSTLAATALAVKNLAAKLNALIPTTRLVGTQSLADDVVLTKDDFGLGSVENVADVDMPANTNFAAELDQYSTTDHIHNLNDFNYTHATTTVVGIYRYSYTTDAPTDVSVATPAAVAIGQYSATVSYINKMPDKIPTNLLDMTQFGGGGYLPIPVVGSYQASGPNNSAMCISSFIHPDGTFVGLRNGADINTTGVFYMYGKLKDGVLQNLVTTTTRYAPKGMPANSFVSRAGRASDTALLFAMSDAVSEKLCLSLLGGTMNGSQHQWCYVDIDTSFFGGRDLSRAYPFVHQNYCYIASFRNWTAKGALTLAIFRAPLESVKAGGHVAFERMTLSGFDIHGDARTDTEFVLIAAAMTTVEGGKALILNKSGAGSSNNIFHSNSCSSSFYNDNGVLKMFFGSQGNQYIPAIENYSNHLWDVDVQVNLGTGEVTNPAGLANTQITINPDGSRSGGLLGSGVEASGIGGWDWESGLDCSNGFMLAWRGHWASGWYVGQTTSESGRSMSEFFNAPTRDHHRVAELRVINSFGSASHDYLHSVAFGEGNYVYGRNITDGICWRAKVTLYGDGQFSPSVIGFGPTTEREELSWDAFVRQKNHITYVDGDSAISLGGIIRTGQLNAKVNFADTVQVSITQAQHDALRSALQAASGAAAPGDESLTLFIPSDVSMQPIAIYQYTLPSGKYKSINQYVAKIGVSARTGALATVTLGEVIAHRQNLNVTVGSVAGPEGTDTGSGILKTSNGKLLYVVNAVNRAYYVGWMSCFGLALEYDIATAKFEDSWTINHDNAFGPNGALLVPRFGYVGLKTDSSATAVLATTYGFDTAAIQAGTIANQTVILHSSQVTAGWRLYFTEPVRYFVKGKVYNVPAASLDLSTLFPGAYQNSTFYIYANISGGVGVYEVSKTKSADTDTRTLIGQCTTGTDRILSLSADRVTNIFNLRNIVDHFNDKSPHGLVALNKATAGLNLVQNLGLYESLSQMSSGADVNYASGLLAMRAGNWIDDGVIVYGAILEGGVVPLPAGFADNECLIFVEPFYVRSDELLPITEYGIVFNRATRTLTVATAHLINGGMIGVECAYTVLASKKMPLHLGSWT